jgi:hypothetical protein
MLAARRRLTSPPACRWLLDNTALTRLAVSGPNAEKAPERKGAVLGDLDGGQTPHRLPIAQPDEKEKEIKGCHRRSGFVCNAALAE